MKRVIEGSYGRYGRNGLKLRLKLELEAAIAETSVWKADGARVKSRLDPMLTGKREFLT